MPAGRGQLTGTPRWGYPSHRMRGGPLPIVKPRKRFKWNEMANCGDAYVFSTILAAVNPCYHLIVNHLRYTTDVKRGFRKGGS